jgi:hypothetical protein
MPAVTVTVAEAVKDMITAATFSQTELVECLTVERSYADWSLELKKATGLKVDVVAVISEQKVELANRESYAYEIPVDIAIRQRFSDEKWQDENGRAAVAEVDALMLFTQEVFELFMPERLTGFDSAVWNSTQILVAPHTDHLRKHKQFTSVVRLVFGVNRSMT